MKKVPMTSRDGDGLLTPRQTDRFLNALLNTSTTHGQLVSFMNWEDNVRNVYSDAPATYNVEGAD